VTTQPPLSLSLLLTRVRPPRSHPCADHSYWGRPEEQTGARPAYVWDATKPASDAAGAAASALASASLLFRASDPEYAAACLDHARRLFKFASKVCQGSWARGGRVDGSGYGWLC
jgi:hypothetical protein